MRTGNLDFGFMYGWIRYFKILADWSGNRYLCCTLNDPLHFATCSEQTHEQVVLNRIVVRAKRQWVLNQLEQL